MRYLWVASIAGSLFGVVLLSGCAKQDYSEIEVLGHAGYGLENPQSIYPGNSQASIRLALAHPGCNGVELDARLSKDGHIWFFHDGFLDNTTNGSGCVENYTNSELMGIKYTGLNNSSTGNFEANLTQLKYLADVLVTGKTIHFDIRHMNPCTNQQVDSVAFINQLNVFRQTRPNTRVICHLHHIGWMKSFVHHSLEVYAQIDSWSGYQSVKKQVPAIAGFVLDKELFTRDQIGEMKQDGYEVSLFHMRSPRGIRAALRKLPTSIISDDVPGAIIEKE